MKYEVIDHGARLEAVGAHSGYRIRMSTSAARDLDAIPFVGLLDDIVLVPLAIRWLLGRVPAHIRADAERRAGARV